MAFAVNDGVRIFYEDTGGPGPVILFLHEFAGGSPLLGRAGGGTEGPVSLSCRVGTRLSAFRLSG